MKNQHNMHVNSLDRTHIPNRKGKGSFRSFIYVRNKIVQPTYSFSHVLFHLFTLIPTHSYSISCLSLKKLMESKDAKHYHIQ